MSEELLMQDMPLVCVVQAHELRAGMVTSLFERNGFALVDMKRVAGGAVLALRRIDARAAAPSAERLFDTLPSGEFGLATAPDEVLAILRSTFRMDIEGDAKWPAPPAAAEQVTRSSWARWTVEEEQTLIAAVAELGPCWAEVAPRIGNGRSANACSQHYKSVAKSSTSGAESAPAAPPVEGAESLGPADAAAAASSSEDDELPLSMRPGAMEPQAIGTAAKAPSSRAREKTKLVPLPYVSEVRALAEHMKQPAAVVALAVANARDLAQSQRVHDEACSDKQCRLRIHKPRPGPGPPASKRAQTAPVACAVLDSSVVQLHLAAAIVLRYTLREVGEDAQLKDLATQLDSLLRAELSEDQRERYSAIVAAAAEVARQKRAGQQWGSSRKRAREDPSAQAPTLVATVDVGKLADPVTKLLQHSERHDFACVLAAAGAAPMPPPAAAPGSFEAGAPPPHEAVLRQLVAEGLELERSVRNPTGSYHSIAWHSMA